MAPIYIISLPLTDTLAFKAPFFLIVTEERFLDSTVNYITLISGKLLLEKIGNTSSFIPKKAYFLK